MAFLSEKDFSVWEILLDTRFRIIWTRIFWANRYPNYYCAHDMAYPQSARGYSPRTLGCRDIQERGIPDEAYILRWNPPSDYPIGYQNPEIGKTGIYSPGTRLHFYNIYRKDARSSSPNWTLYHQIEINNPNGSGKSWQK